MLHALQVSFDSMQVLPDAITAAMRQQEQMALNATGNVNQRVERNESVALENSSHAVSEGDLLKLAEAIRSRLGRLQVSEWAWHESLRPHKPKPAGLPRQAGKPAGNDIELF